MTSIPAAEAGPPIQRVAIVGTGLIGTSIALAARRAGARVVGWDADRGVADRSAATGALEARASLEDAVRDADLVVVCTPIPDIAEAVVGSLRAAPAALVTDAGSIKAHIVEEVASGAEPADLGRYIPGHPLGGSERSGPEHAAASVVDDIVWVLAPIEASEPAAAERVARWIERLGARPVVLTPERHDRLVAYVSHLPQVASTSLMALAATEEAGEPDLLLLAAGGFRDLTRLAASNPRLWSEILLANRDQIVEAIDAFAERLGTLREQIAEGDADGVERTFSAAKAARLRLAAKPTVRAGVAVLQVGIADEPGALARITATLGAGEVNIEDLQIVHSPEGGRGTVHLTVAASAAEAAVEVLRTAGHDAIRLA
ncbi:MAG TPA: prephenate dehydrogenase/arogenate dehydrogenase family protein [Actinomycetota bacterium]|nr:prephenate dehydrogenase/arogenate dehydrogenase family protein [Actinomycetota bacterium]